MTTNTKISLNIPREGAQHYVLVTGKRWQKVEWIDSGWYRDSEFPCGEHKITTWINGWPRIIYHFTIEEDGSITEHFSI